MPVSALSQARKAVAAQDPRYTDSNRGIVGRERYEVIGLPRGTTHRDIVDHFAKWKTGWHVLPQRQYMYPMMVKSHGQFLQTHLHLNDIMKPQT